jgi:signal transduction histidine kinase
MGKGYTSKGDFAEALKFQTKALITAESVNARLEMGEALNGLGETYFKQGKPNQALHSFSQARGISLEIGAELELKSAYQGLAQTYAALSDFNKAYHYQTLLTAAKDSLYNTETVVKMGNLQALYENEKQQAEIDLLTKDKSLQFLELQRQNMIRNFLIAGITLILILAFILFRNITIKQKANKLLAIQNEEINLQKEEIESQRDNLEQTYNHLKNTQAQLVHAEKMASLGELTAGIAHEIQNPLNFVNNFSELNYELIFEMRTEIDKGNYEEAKEIAQDIADNQQKIKNHGKRADAIVKGMLQHSRNASGKKETTDINVLTEEYVRIAYQGLKAKDLSVNVTLQTNFDTTIGHIKIIQQDVGRVIVNLLNNAYYSVILRKKEVIENYEPTVSIYTKKTSDYVIIFISDNGKGIPELILNKIFQPFFTTKPTGEGTGLGLSLAYDIIKAHDGELLVESKEGEGTTFSICLPHEKFHNQNYDLKNILSKT